MERRVPRSTPPHTAVKRVIAELEECRPSQLGTLEETVGRDSLDTLVDPPSGERADAREPIRFRYCGYTLELHADRTLHIEA